MFSEKATKHADACRFCWMCRHICPVGQRTGKEANNARAKGLLVSLLNRGYEYDETFAEAMYECLLCGACSEDCATGFEPPVFIREARTAALVDELTPKPVLAAVDKLLGSGNIFGKTAEETAAAIHAVAPDSKPGVETLLYIGSTALFKSPETARAAVYLFGKAGVEYCVLPNEPQSGAELFDLIGRVQETEDMVKQLVDAIDGTGARQVIVLDPTCARMLKQDGPAFGFSPKAEIVTATSFFAALIREGRIAPSRMDIQYATYHDPCRLARDLDETGAAREIIAAMGITIREMLQNGKLTRCCGSELVHTYNPRITEQTGAARVSDARRLGLQAIITSCPACQDVLSTAAKDDMQVVDLYTLLARACGM